MIRLAISKNGPIALDIGSNSVKMLQFTRNNGQISVAAADKIQCKPQLTDDPQQRKSFIVDSIQEMIRRGGFSGTKVVSCLPNQDVKIKSLRLDPAAAENIDGQLKEELAERFNIDPDKDEIRRITAGKVYTGTELKDEVIFFVTQRETILNQIELIEEAGLIPEAIDPVPCAVLRSFQRSMRRQEDQEIVRSFVDIGNLSTTVMIGSCNQILFIKQISAGGKQFNENVSTKLGIGIEEAMLLRSKIQHGNTDSINNSTKQAVADAMSHSIEQLSREISMCFKYCAVTFRGKHPEEVIITGGEAYENVLTDALGKYLNIDVKIGRPLEGIELCNTSFGWDQNSSLSEWAVTVGLGLKNWQVNNYVSN